jgi:hypothetical protein
MLLLRSLRPNFIFFTLHFRSYSMSYMTLFLTHLGDYGRSEDSLAQTS